MTYLSLPRLMVRKGTKIAFNPRPLVHFDCERNATTVTSIIDHQYVSIFNYPSFIFKYNKENVSENGDGAGFRNIVIQWI
jgi:hypothetical protein